MDNQNEQITEKKKRFFDKEYLIGLLISFIVTGVMFGTIMIIEIYGVQLSLSSDLYLILINSFTVSGGLSILFYLLVVLTSFGAFDLITYSVKLAWHMTFHKELRSSKLPKSFHEYRAIKNGEEKRRTSFMLLGALPYLITGAALCIPYYILVR